MILFPSKATPQHFPILFWSIHFLIGCGFFFYPSWCYFIPLIALSFFSKRKLQGWIFTLAGFLFAFFRLPSMDFEKLEGIGIFSLESIHPTQSPFIHSYSLKGVFDCFESEGKKLFHIPCIIFSKKLPETGKKWLLHGTLQKNHGVIFKPKKDVVWKKLPSSFSLTHWRFQKKETLRKHFHQSISDKRTCHFFASLATGDIDDRLLSMEFQKVGLSHILAISGFHFALLAGVLGWFLKKICSPVIAYSLLLGFLTSYFFFLGITPSILRAYIMIVFYLLGLLLHRKVDILNLLGLALFIELIYDPNTIQQVGFHLSFLATIGILLFFSPLNQLLIKFFPKRNFISVKKFSFFEQHAYILCCFLRNALALNFSVYLTTLPALFYFFCEFPLLSIFYNIFFPPLLGISLLLLPFGLFFPFLEQLNEKYTREILLCIANPPEILNFKIHSSSISFSILLFFLTIVLGFGLTKSWEKVNIFTLGRSLRIFFNSKRKKFFSADQRKL